MITFRIVVMSIHKNVWHLLYKNDIFNITEICRCIHKTPKNKPVAKMYFKICSRQHIKSIIKWIQAIIKWLWNKFMPVYRQASCLVKAEVSQFCLIWKPSGQPRLPPVNHTYTTQPYYDPQNAKRARMSTE